jgi:hypothetical protein
VPRAGGARGQPPPASRHRREGTTPLLERIAAYQQLTGKKEHLPKSLRKLLRTGDSRQREREHLRARLATVSLDAAARLRLHRLENADRVVTRAAKIRRAAEEVFLLLGIEALGAVAPGLAEAKCNQHLGVMVKLLSPDQLRGIALWIDRMTDPERDRLRTVIAARSLHGREYKRHLADNQVWISWALV